MRNASARPEPSGKRALLREALVARPFPRFAAALVAAGALHVALFVLLHVRPGPAAPATRAAEDIVPYIEATDVQLAPGAPASGVAPVVPAAVGPEPRGAAVSHSLGPSLGPALEPTAEGSEPSAEGVGGTSPGSPTEAGGSDPGGAASATAGSGTPGASHLAGVVSRGDREGALAQILARVRGARRYPEAARRRELEGVVRVRFFVGPDGRPRDVTASDGEAMLQRAAIEAVERAAPLPLVDGPVEVDEDFRLDAIP